MILAVILSLSMSAQVDAGPAPDYSDVRQAICETGKPEMRIGNRVVLAGSCARTIKNPNGYVDVLLGPSSLATANVCSSSLNQCPENNNCLAADTPEKFLCRCRGSLYHSMRKIGPGTCPAGSHNGCAVILTMTRAQWHVLRAVALSPDLELYPQGVKGVISSMRDDPRRTNNMSQAPMCLRSEISVRMGRSDLSIAEDDNEP